MIDLARLINRTSVRLRPLPAAAVQLSSVVAISDFKIDDAVDVISSDAVLAADVLRFANSASSASVRKIGTMREAVLRLGANRILEWILGRQVSGEMSRAMEEYSLEARELWRHSLATALASERIRAAAVAEGIEVPAIVYSAALLHDIGKLMLASELTVEKRAEIARRVGEGKTYVEAEAEVCGITHADAGAGLLRVWNLPEPLCRAVEMHHRPEAHQDPLTDTVHMANLVAKTAGIGLGSEGLVLRASTETAERLRLSHQEFERIALYVVIDLAKFDLLFSEMKGNG